MNTKPVLLLFAALIIVLTATAAYIDMKRTPAIGGKQLADSTQGFAVVELFTSEGCSSCPPADALMERIEKENKNKQIYILAFHVDYWDHQGWKDPFSNPAYTARQQRYAEWLRLGSLYTPQVVINGATEYVGSDQQLILRAIAAGLSKPGMGQLSLNTQVQGSKLQVGYQAPGQDKKEELVLAVVRKNGASDVEAGENTGRHLSHVQIVQQLQVVPAGNHEVTFTLPSDFRQYQWEVIGFLQHKGNGLITRAARSPL
ncbi:DUF1223 domain-containing protein [Chitinophaga pendula]|uniref:DUF1223 domain-containing protein n=1 Tax=Chitinophaga TaxID=79328 RepID=UPI000BAF09E2|nr:MULTISPECIES: DUF1223 domain-containing protein [Chitinophaga]ASZ12196.1 DUF1223 domain-containing protein [Chitinophaga sp. MD30]UCJ04774.1 DUF1223 domain-containing protein [Chitinophaga pendula]